MKIEEFLILKSCVDLGSVIRHTVVHHSSTSTYIPNFIGIGKTFCGPTYRRTDGHNETHIIRSTLRSRPKNENLRQCKHVFEKNIYITVSVELLIHFKTSECLLT